MTAEFGIDIAWARPTVAEIQATGAKWVARYLSTDSTKNLTASEVRDYAAAGISTVVVWETSAGRATAGYAAGVADARAAESQRQADGLPATMPIHFAVDEDVPWSSVEQYFAGAASVVGKSLTGTYGGFDVIEGAHAAGYRFLWQTLAWSGGRWSQWATIRQTGGTVLGGSADVDYAQASDYGQDPRPSTTPTTTTPAEDTMPQWINGSVTPGPAPVVVLVPAGSAWSAFPHRTLHLGMDEPGVVGAHASVRVAVHDGGPDWKSVETVPVTAKGGTVAVDVTGAVKVSLQTVSPGVSYSVEVW